MGYNTTIVVMNDALDAIAEDKNFGAKLRSAVLEASGFGKKHVVVSAMGHANAATVIETHHADEHVISVVGANCGQVLGRGWGYADWRKADVQEKLLHEMADAFGFRLVKKPVKK